MFLAVKREGSTGVRLQLEGIEAGAYQVRVYDVEWNGIIRSRRPAVRGVASVIHRVNSGRKSYIHYSYIIGTHEYTIPKANCENIFNIFLQ